MLILKRETKEFEKLLIEKETTQAALAKKLGINRNAITNLKQGTHRSIGEIKARKLCKILEISFEEWFMP